MKWDEKSFKRGIQSFVTTWKKNYMLGKYYAN